MPSEEKRKKFWTSVKKIKFYFGQEHREGGGKNSLSKKNAKNMVEVPLLSVFLGDRSLIKEL